MEMIFDDQRRSKAHIQLLAMRDEGLVDEEALGQLSKEFLERTDPTRVNW